MLQPAHLFTHQFPGTIWNTLSVEEQDWLILEVRDDTTFKVTFSLLEYTSNQFKWKDISLPETWWVSLVAANSTTILLSEYLNKGGNPDHKSLIAVDAITGKIRWREDDLSFVDWTETEVFGYRTHDHLIPIRIDLATGEEREESWETPSNVIKTNPRPVFYAEGTAHFETIKKFVAQTDYTICKGVEYLEFNDWIIMSVYVEESGKLANYLLVFSTAGTLVLTLKLGEKLAGLGTDTFFLLSGCLFLVQNKTDLVAYRL